MSRLSLFLLPFLHMSALSGLHAADKLKIMKSNGNTFIQVSPTNLNPELTCTSCASSRTNSPIDHRLHLGRGRMGHVGAEKAVPLC